MPKLDVNKHNRSTFSQFSMKSNCLKEDCSNISDLRLCLLLHNNLVWLYKFRARLGTRLFSTLWLVFVVETFFYGLFEANHVLSCRQEFSHEEDMDLMCPEVELSGGLVQLLLYIIVHIWNNRQQYYLQQIGKTSMGTSGKWYFL